MSQCVVTSPSSIKLVQVGHACLEAAWRFEKPAVPCNLVVVSVRSLEQLLVMAGSLEAASVAFALFCEPDHAMGYTALATEPIENGHRAFRRLELWKVPP